MLWVLIFTECLNVSSIDAHDLASACLLVNEIFPPEVETFEDALAHLVRLKWLARLHSIMNQLELSLVSECVFPDISECHFSHPLKRFLLLLPFKCRDMKYLNSPSQV